jgi:hypothetical protein
MKIPVGETSRLLAGRGADYCLNQLAAPDVLSD